MSLTPHVFLELASYVPNSGEVTEGEVDWMRLQISWTRSLTNAF